ncbi:hypothetical protein B0J14DRAFT_586710 [Halenospora varia]|nr:hypothetical protein B0J14DRAFT_586710 [Halenospora varia]
MTLTDTSNGTFELVVQYLHTGKFILPANIRDSVETVTQLLDFAVLTDVLLIPNAHTAIGERLTSLLKPFTNGNANTRLPLHTEHLANALGLPEGHPIRVLIVQACVFMYLRSIHRLQKFKFEKELREIDGFAADMFCEVDKVMRLKGKNRGLVFAGEVWVCPMTGEQGRL